MKIKDGYLLREVAGNYIVVAIGEQAVDFDGVITINEIGAFIWKLLEKGAELPELIDAVLNEYDVEKSIVETDINNFIDKMKKAELLA